MDENQTLQYLHYFLKSLVVLITFLPEKYILLGLSLVCSKQGVLN